jgi:hypothetical protein
MHKEYKGLEAVLKAISVLGAIASSIVLFESLSENKEILKINQKLDLLLKK